MVEYFEAVVIQRKNFTNRKKRLNDKNYIYSYVSDSNSENTYKFIVFCLATTY